MALINTLRNKMGRIVVIAIAASILAFIAGDLLGPNSALLGNNTNDVGEIAGRTVTLAEYQSKIDEIARDYSINTGQSPSGDAMYNIRQQAWDALINEKAFYSYFDELGVQVTDDEIWDMTQGKNVDPALQRSFVNQETGEFDRQLVIDFLKGLANQPPQAQAAWFSFEKNLAPNRRMNKFQNLFLKTNYVTEAEAQQQYNSTSKSASVKYLYVPFVSISDSTFKVTNDMLEDYIDDNSERYQEDEYRSVAYVAFDVDPSVDDTLSINEEMEELRIGLQNSQNDSLYARANSDGGSPFLSYTVDLLPTPIQDEISNIEEGDVVGPELFAGKYVLYKLSGIEEADEYSAKASHILIKWDDESASAKADARRRANDVLGQIRNGADFAEMARIHGTDGTATRGGDLGWFSDGRMVDEFQDAVFAARRTGLINRLVETEFGYHIIDVTGLKTNLSYKVATIEREIIPSDETRNVVFREASLFVANSDDWDAFQVNAKEKDLNIIRTAKVNKNDRRISSLANARGVVTWLYNTASVGSISDVFELDDQYVIAVMTGLQPEGIAKLSSVQAEVAKKVRDREKTKMINEKLSDLSGSIEDIAASYGSEAKVNSMTDLKLSANSLNGVGIAPEAVGRIFAMSNGDRSEAFATDNGVLIVEVESITEPAAIDDYTTYQSQLAQNRFSRISFSITQAMKEFADIEDERHRFF